MRGALLVRVAVDCLWRSAFSSVMETHSDVLQLVLPMMERVQFCHRTVRGLCKYICVQFLVCRGAYPCNALGVLAFWSQSTLGVTGCATRFGSARLKEWLKYG